MSAILGVSGLYHDSAAALVIDGKLVCAVQEERLSRRKNDAQLPLRAINWCLQNAGITAQALERVVYYEDPFRKLERVLLTLLRGFPRTARLFPSAIGSQLSHRIWVLDELRERLQISRERVVAADHHESHASFAYLTSGFEEAAVLTLDGVGEHVSTALYHGSANQIRPIEHWSYPNSLGLLYAALTAYLGFEVGDGEYKVMGLAAFGEDRYAKEFERIIQLDANGNYHVRGEYLSYELDDTLGYSRRLVELLGPARAPGRRFEVTLDAHGAPQLERDDLRFAHIAASLQTRLERAMVGLARRARERTGATRLCLAGGVALNAVAVSAIARSGLFEKVYVPPGAGDAGGAIGAALLAAGAKSEALISAALGPGAAPDVALRLTKQLGLHATPVDDVHERAAAALARGKSVAWVRGRTEFGPRALGQRSLLTAASSSEARERINRQIKRREPFRPFAPLCRHADYGRYFSAVDLELSRFMTGVCTVDRPELVPATTHVDGSARLQLADRGSDVERLLEAYALVSEVPVLLNTSLNGRGEPIASSSQDALMFLLEHPIDALVLENLWITRDRAAVRPEVDAKGN